MSHALYKFLHYIRKFAKYKHSFALIPTKGSQTKFFQINNISLFIIFFILSSLTYLCASHLLHRTSLKKEIHNLKATQYNDQYHLNTYVRHALLRQSNLQEYHQEINRILNMLDTQNIPHSTSNYPFRIYQEHNLHSNFQIPSPILLLHQSTLQTIELIQRLKQVQIFTEIQQTLFKHIPHKWPMQNDKGYKTSPFGVRLSPFVENAQGFHTGADLAAPPNTPIVAAAHGVITFAGTKKGYGYTIIIKHQFGYKTLYGHNAKNLVSVNQHVKQGQRIALLGNTGKTTGYHLHFEIRIKNVPIDPWPYLTHYKQ